MKRILCTFVTSVIVVVGFVALEGRQAKRPDEAAIDKVFARGSTAPPARA